MGFLNFLSAEGWRKRKCAIEKECCRNCKFLTPDQEYLSWWCKNKNEYIQEDVDNVVCDLFFNEIMRLKNFDKDNNFRKTDKKD